MMRASDRVERVWTLLGGYFWNLPLIRLDQSAGVPGASLGFYHLPNWIRDGHWLLDSASMIFNGARADGGREQSLRGRLAFLRGDFPSAKMFFDLALADDPACRRTLAWRGQLRAAGSSLRSALEDLSRAAEPADWVWPRVWLGHALLLSRDFEGAQAAESQALRLDPGNVPARVLRGLARRESGHGRGAFEDFAVAARLDPSCPGLRSLLGLRRSPAAGAPRPRGPSRPMDFFYARAVAAVESLRARAPERCVQWVEQAEIALHSGNIGLALKSLEKAEALDPGEGEKRRLAAVYLNLKDYPKALAHLESLLRKCPDDAELWICQAKAALSAGDRKRAVKALARAEALKPDDAGRRRMAALYRGLNDIAGLARNLRQLTRRGRGDAALWIDQAEAALRLGNRPLASRSLAGAGRRKPGDHDRRRMVGLLRELGDFNGALALLGPLLRRFPREAGLRVEQADAAIRCGHRELALRALAQAEGLGPSGAEARRMAAVTRDLRQLEAPPRLLIPGGGRGTQ